MNKIIKYIIRSLFSLLMILTTYFLLSVVFSLTKTNPKTLYCDKNRTIYISTNGVHLDIIIPIENLNETLTKKLKIIEDAKFVSFAWGNKNFYLNTPTWNDLTFKTAFKALFWNRESALHVIFYKNLYQDWKQIKLCQTQLDSLNLYVENSFKTDSKNNFIKIKDAGYSYNDYFYEAVENYSIYKTCNIWVNNALKKSEVATSIWSPFDFGVLWHIE